MAPLSFQFCSNSLKFSILVANECLTGMKLCMPDSTMNRPLFLLLSLKAFLMAAVIVYAGIGLGPDEAQYWTWSRALDWGYYSKPPGIAWQIWLGTQLFGQTEWGVRSLSVALAFFQAWAVYLLALRAGLLPRTAFWCGLIMAFCPLGMMGSLFAITDVGFLICWTGACLTVVSALNRKTEPDPLITGAWILAGALFKWPIFLFWPFYLLCRHWYFPYQKRTRLIAGIVLSLAGLLPSLWWNWSHDWATFRHVLATLQGGSGHHKTGGNIAEFIGAQAFLLSPILFLLLMAGCVQWVRQRRNLPPALFFCGFVTVASLGAMALAACFQKVQGNWIALTYPTAIILLGWDSFQEHPGRRVWAKVGLALSIALTALFIFLPSFYTVPSLVQYAPAFRLNPFRHNMGGPEIRQALARHGYDPDRHFLFSDKYQAVSILSFYSGGQKRAYFLNLNHSRKNQFSYWPSFQEEQPGATGYFVWIENLPHLKRDWQNKLSFYQAELKPYFESVEFLEFAPLLSDEKEAVKGALIFRCKNCKEHPLPDSELY